MATISPHLVVTRALALGVLLIASAARSSAAQEGSIAELTTLLLRTELKGGGWRDSMVWYARDSSSYRVMQEAQWPAGDRILPPQQDQLQCPSGTDAAGQRISRPVGYTLRVFTEPYPNDGLLLDLSVTCRFTYGGKARGFGQSSSWLLARSGGGWRVVQLMSKGMT